MIDKFDGEYRFLSNFYPAPVVFEGVEYPCVENAYQAAKTTDVELRKQFEGCTPGKAKKLGRSLPIRDDWHKVRVWIMADLVTQKFTGHKDLGDMLLATENHELVEGNYWGDTFWGISNNEGLNMLGHILMGTREGIRIGKDD